MNREIKFRVWDSDSHSFRYFNLGDKNLHWMYLNVLHFNERIQQFAGLKDSHSKDIYEGDILKEHHYEDWGDKEGFEYIGVVRHRAYSNDAGNQFSGFVTYPNLRENEGYAGNPIKVDCEVIGNIFENPELLT